jgi:chitin disaccharide deacetylase
MKRFGLLLALILPSLGMAATPTLAERLGYPADAKLLIIHADDLGMANSVNAASIEALRSGAINSASIMVPCAWLPQIATFARANPDADLGLHLTLTSEWTGFRWRPLLGPDRVPSLYDPSGFLYPTETAAAERIDPKEAEAEVRAQIERALALGIRPTHLDAHMRTLHMTPQLFAVQLRVAREYGIPAAISKSLAENPDFAPLLAPGDIVIERFATIGTDVEAADWPRWYANVVETLRPGITQLIVHVAYDDAEMQGATFDHPAWGAAWRQRDFDVLSSEAFRATLRENGVQLVTWRELAERAEKAKGNEAVGRGIQIRGTGIRAAAGRPYAPKRMTPEVLPSGVGLTR